MTKPIPKKDWKLPPPAPKTGLHAWVDALIEDIKSKVQEDLNAREIEDRALCFLTGHQWQEKVVHKYGSGFGEVMPWKVCERCGVLGEPK